MGCCCQKENMAHLSGQELLDRRRCPTDWPILLTFLGFIFGMVVIVWWAWDNGDFNKLYYGTDWRGTACCTNGENCHQFWPNPIYYSALGSVCLANCPGQDADWASGDYHHDGAYNGTAQFPPSGLVCHCNPALVANLTDLKYGAAPGLDIPSWLMSNGRDISQVFSHPDSIVGQKCSAATAAGQSYATWTYSEALSQHVTARAQSLWDFSTFHNQVGKTGQQFFGYGDALSYTPTFVTFSTFTPAYPGYYQEIAALGNTKKYLAPFCNFIYGTTKAINRCIPDVTSITRITDYVCGNIVSCGMDEFNDWFSQVNDVWHNMMADVFTCWYVIATSTVIAIVIGFLYLYLMEKCAKCIIVVGLLMVNVMLIGLAGVFWYYYFDLKDKVDTVPQLASHDTDQSNMNICLGFAMVFSIIEGIVFCICCCLCRQIQTAAEIIMVAADGLGDMPYLIFYPLVNVFLLLAYVAVWAVVAVMLATCGEDTFHYLYGYHSWDYTDKVQYIFAYWLFGLLWIAEFSSSVGFVCVSYCFCVWFFTEHDEHGRNRKSHPEMLCKVVCNTLLYFTGTIAFGSLIVAIIQMLRIILTYIEQKQKEYTGMDKPPCFLRWMFCCCHCCLKCLECCMKYLNKNAYIQTILHDHWFCPALCRVIKVMIFYIDYILITKSIAAGMLAFGRAAIAMGTAAVGGYWASTLDVSSIIAPTLLMLIIGFVVAAMFTEVYEMGIDTMLMCFCEAKSNDTINKLRLPPQMTELQKRADKFNEDRETERAGKAAAVAEDADSAGVAASRNQI